MGTVLEDVTSETIDAEHIQRRVKDWKKRVNEFFTSISGWLPDGWEAKSGAPVSMNEELMRKYDVDAIQMPTLEFRDCSGHVAKIVPRGLWTIGTNGRIDLKLQGQHYLIVDMAENFKEPDWQAVRAEERQIRETVNKAWLRRILQ